MPSLNPCAIAGLVLFVVGLALGAVFDHWLMSGEVQSLKKDQALALAAAESGRADAEVKYRQLEDQLRTELTQVKDDAKRQTDRMLADAADARATADSLRQQVARVTNRCAASAAATAATGGAPATNAGDMLADVLGSMEAEGRAMAEEAERRGIAGRACEQAYNSAFHQMQAH